MDKNKSRTDLLAAGRKKLQQFRQKKDYKGSSSSSGHGKSLKKSSKLEQHELDADAASSTGMLVEVPQVVDREIESRTDSSLGNVDSVVSSSVAPDVDVVVIDSSSVPITPEAGVVETALANNAGVGVQEVEARGNEIDLSNPDEGESSQIIDDNVTRVGPMGSSDVPDSETETKHDDAFVSVDVSAPPMLVDATDGLSVTAETGSKNGEDRQQSLPSREDTPDTSSFFARGDQVTDVGAMQEADGLGLIQVEGGGRVSFFGHVELAESVGEAASEQIHVEEAASQPKHFDRQDDASVSAAATDVSDTLLASTLAVSEAHGTSGVIYADTKTPSDVENLEILSGSEHHGDEEGVRSDRLAAEVLSPRYLPEESFILIGEKDGRPLSNKLVSSSQSYSLSPLGDARSMSFLQLVEVIKGLSENDYRLLLKSRESDSNAELGNGGSFSPQDGLQGLLDRLREELFLTNCTKDILQLQLFEQSNLQMEYDHHFQQLDDEISVLRASLKEAGEMNSSLGQELMECRSELQASVNAREDLEQQCHAAKAEVEEASARAYELQNSLERSKLELLSLSKESADSKDFVAAMQVEIENLKGTIVSMTEERKILAEQKDSCFHENEMLLKELADCKNLVATLQVESSNLSGTVASVMGERMKLEGEKEYLANYHEKICMELSDCKGLVESLQAENVRLSESLAVATEERKKLEDDISCSVQERDRLSSELLVLHDKPSKDHGECMRLESELKEVTMHLEQLAEENTFLNSSLVVYKAKIREIDDPQVQSSSLVGRAVNQVGSLEILSRVGDNATDGEGHGEDNFSMLEKSMSSNDAGSLPPEPCRQEVFDDSLGFAVIKGHLEEAEKILHGLEKAIDGMHFHSVSLSRADGRTAAPAVSKLIQAFESKVHHDESEVEHDSMSEARSPTADPFALSKEQTGNLRAILKQLVLDAENATLAFKSERDDRTTASATIRELKAQFEALKEHSDNLEATNIELGVLYEAINQHMSGITEKNNELEVLCESLRQQDSSLKAENSELGKKLSECELKIEELQSQLYGLQQSSDERASLLHDQLANFQIEAAQRALMVEQEWNSTIAQIVEAVERLSDSTGFVTSIGSQGSLDISSRVAASVNAAISMIVDLKEKLEALRGLQQSSDERASVLHDELANFQIEAAQRALTVEQEWNSIITQIVEAVERLDDSAGFVTSTSSHCSLDISSRVAASVNAAIKMIVDLKEKLKAAARDHETASILFKEVNEKCNELLGKNELTNVTLHKLYSELRNLVIDSCGSVEETGTQDEELPDPLDYSSWQTLFEKLEDALAERLQLQSTNNKLHSELMCRTKDVEELSRRCLDLSSIQRLIEDVEGVVKLEDAVMDSEVMPISRLESLVSFLVLNLKEANGQVNSSREEFGSKVMELTEVQEKIDQLTVLKLQHENEILLLKERLTEDEEALVAMQSKLQEKISELEQSEQRVSSIREKLSIAVAKGKGLVVQRDSLKQSLGEKSSELERCSQELQLKDARLQEVEAKLKTYSEAGERVEALESELSYIRNSATALRESFLLKDSVLQRIEEILEDLDLPEHFHSRGIIEKVDWLARSATGNSLLPTDWDQKSSVGGLHSDTGFVVMDAWKEDVQLSSNSGDDLRRKYEELQGKFYGLAEQNEMLEQSLMERNNLVQTWEQHLDRINLPSHLRTAEPEDRIDWLGNALSEANRDRNSLLQKIDELENVCGSLTADLEESQQRVSYLNAEMVESQKRTSELERDLQAVIHEKGNLSERFEILTSDVEKLSAETVHFELENEKLQKEVSALQEKLLEKLAIEDHTQSINDEISRLQDLVCDALQDPGAKDSISGGSSTVCLESLLRKLIENYTTPLVVTEVEECHAETSDVNAVEGRTRDLLDAKELDVTFLKDTVGVDEINVDALKKELEETLSELACLKEERDTYIEKQQSLVFEVETMEKKREELQDLLHQEEQKSVSAREKLNVAVRKGKSLVQQRDSLKQTIEEMNSELVQLKSDIKDRENALSDYEQKMRDMTTYSGRVEALESENLLLRNRLAETEQLLHEKGHILTMILDSLGDIDVGDEIYNNDPIEKLACVGKLCHDLRATVASAEQESRKSGRAAELLLAELNEVQDRNDSLQDELAKATTELTEISKEWEKADAAKREALSCLERSFMVHSEEKTKLYSQLVVLKSSANKLRKSFSDINNLLAGVFAMELEFLQNVKFGMESCLKRPEANHVVHVPSFGASDGVDFSNSENMENFLSLDFSSQLNMADNFDDNFITEVCSSVQELVQGSGALKATLHEHSRSLHDQASNLSKLFEILHKVMTSQKESLEAMKKDIKHVESIEKEKEMEISALHRSISLLYEACTSSLMEIENGKAEVAGNTLAAGNRAMNFKPARFSVGEFPSEEHIKAMVERLLSAVTDFSCMKGGITEGDRKEMKLTISNLQKELQEKDVQRERICMELVSQIKEAETTVTSYSLDLQSSRTRVHDLEKQVEMMEEDQSLLEQNIKKLKDEQAVSAQLQEKVRSLTNVLSSKDQEIEALMQALDEEEVQMEDLTNKTKELEKILQQKNLDIENLEASRGKALKKLSITINKFDELHHFSENLLGEVEKLQSQLQERDAEISFLRQEVTRCTNEVLVASQMSSKRTSDDTHELLTWLDTLISQAGMQDVNLDDSSEVQERKELLQKKITNIMSKLKDIQAVAETRNTLVQMERLKVEELTHQVEALENSLQEKEKQLNMLEGVEDSGQAPTAASEIVEVEPVINKWVASGPSTSSQVRSLRKGNNDQVAIAIDMDPVDDSRLQDEDDDKVHGFKSLTTSRIVPKFTRPVSDMVDGLWVSCDRALMRQPALRLGIILYWAVLHALIGTFMI